MLPGFPWHKRYSGIKCDIIIVSLWFLWCVFLVERVDTRKRKQYFASVKKINFLLNAEHFS